MSKGESGRIVIEIEPTLKRKLYSVLAMENLTLKDWFIQLAENYVKEKFGPYSKENKRRKAPAK